MTVHTYHKLRHVHEPCFITSLVVYCIFMVNSFSVPPLPQVVKVKNNLPSIHLIGIASLTIDLAVSIRVRSELVGFVSKN